VFVFTFERANLGAAVSVTPDILGRVRQEVDTTQMVADPPVEPTYAFGTNGGEEERV
jgi:hypothetical protein